MTPYELGVLLWYYCRTGDHPDIVNNPPVWRPTIERFIAESLVKESTESKAYMLTERGFVYVQAVLRVPLPIATWRMEWPTDDDSHPATHGRRPA